jgi:primosomal protein N' (replication factor Y)
MSVRFARALRRQPTEAEKHLWAVLRSRRLAEFKFRRQHPIGPFVADFVCLTHHLVIEADGSQHADSEDDAGRTKWLERHGWRVLRFWNNDVLARTDAVKAAILAALESE